MVKILNNPKLILFFAAIFFLALCLVTYGGILTHQFMMDDRIFVNPHGAIFAFYHHWEDFFKKPLDQHYAPFFVMLNISLFRAFHNPSTFYLIDLILFYINCGLLFIFVYLVSGDLITALLTGIVFCIHPMTADILQHISFNILLVQAIFIESALIALYLYVKFNKHVSYYYFSILMVLFALFCHETVLLFPIYAAALLFFLTDLDFKRIIRIIAPFVLLNFLLIALWLRFVNSVIHEENIQSMHLGFWDTSANFSHLFFWYLSNLFVPRSIEFMCELPPLNHFIWLWNLLFYAFWAGCGLLIFFCLKRSLEGFALVLFLSGFIFAAIFSMSRFKYEGQWVFEPNWVYFPSIGFYIFLVLVILKSGKFLNKFLLMALFSTFFIYLFVSTLNVNFISKTQRSYSEHWLRQFPGNILAANEVASFYYHHKDLEMPSDLMQDMPQTLGLIETISSCKIQPALRKELSYKLAAYYCKNGNKDKCGEIIHRIIGPKSSPYAYVELSYMLYTHGAGKTAIDLLKQCIALYPGYKESYLLIGVILGNDGRFEESIDFFKRGSAIDPADPRFISNIDQVQALINKNHNGH